MISHETVTLPAQRLQTVMLFAMGAMVVSACVCAILALLDPFGTGVLLADLAGYPSGPLETWQSLALMAVVAGHFSLWIILFHLASRVFGNLAEGDADAAAAVARRLSNWLWGMLAWGVVSHMLASVIATWGFAPGERSLAIQLGTAEISIALSALVAGFMARAFALGAELWRDHREVV